MREMPYWPRWSLGVPKKPARWVDSALCAQTDPELWFPEGGFSSKIARGICAVCPVRVECAEYGSVESYGIWAGRSPRERRGLVAVCDEP